MGVYIKGMEMPEGCFDCILSYMWFNGTEMVLQCNVLKKLVSDDGSKDPDCPLIELPPHGRLIDENAIKAWFDEWYDPNVEILVWQLIDEIKNVPTVIPAEITTKDPPTGTFKGDELFVFKEEGSE